MKTPRDPTPFDELLHRRGATVGVETGAGAAAAATRVALDGMLWHAFGRPGQAGAGWWIVGGAEVQLADGTIVRPDLAGFRRRAIPALPAAPPLRERPAWVCDVIPGPTRIAVYGRARITHCWLADTASQTLTVHRWEAGEYGPVLEARPGETVRAEPFAEITIAMDDVFAGDPGPRR
jgi:hypothetical protein